MKGKVLVTDPVHPLLLEGLQRMGYGVDYMPETNQAAVLDIIDQYAGLIVNSKILADVQLIDRAVRLKFIARLGSGLEVIDQVHAKLKDIQYFNSPEGNRDSVAEHAIGMLLTLLNHIHTADKQVREGQWLREQNRGTELKGKTVGIIGFGNTGVAVAQKLSGFGVRILAYDKYVQGFGTDKIMECTLAEIQAQADVVTMHVQLTPETQSMVNAEFISGFEKPFYLLNTSRGKVVDTEGLLWGLENGKVLGAALDVLEQEKLALMNEKQQKEFEKLVKNSHVLLTPHIAGWSYESKKRIAEVILNKLETLYNADVSL